jgi:hypothetical protein
MGLTNCGLPIATLHASPEFVHETRLTFKADIRVPKLSPVLRGVIDRQCRPKGSLRASGVAVSLARKLHPRVAGRSQGILGLTSVSLERGQKPATGTRSQDAMG